MNKVNVEFEIELQDSCGDFVFPDADWDAVSNKDKLFIKKMVEVLSHERFNHEGWLDYPGYKKDACYFILKLIREAS